MTLFKRFGEVFLVFFGVFILYFNLVMALNVTGGNDHITPFLGLFSTNGNRWSSDYYFGFNSIWGIINDIPSAFQFDNFLSLFSKFADTLGKQGIIGSLEKFINMGKQTSSNNVLQLLQVFFTFFQVIIDILISPFKMLIAFIELNIALFDSILQALKFIQSIIEGKYNQEVSGWSSPLEDYFGNSGYNPNISGATAPHGEVSVSGGVVVFQ